MEMLIDHDSVLGGVEWLEEIGRQAVGMVAEASQTTLNGSFSGVSGLDQLGGGHGGVINGGAGSAITVLQSYAEQVEWLSGALASSYQALTGQNAFVARGMDLADEGGTVGADAVSFPTRPQPRFEDFSFTPPTAVPAASIDQLAADFSATRIQECVEASRLWHSPSAETSAIAQSLDEVAQELAGSNRGEVMEKAIGKISEVARAGETFAQNSQTMASSVERLSAIKQDGALEVNYARMALAAIPEPAARVAAEQAFLQSFPAMYTPSLATGVPPIRNLMSMDAAADGGGETALGMDDVEGKGSKHDATGNRPAGGALEAVKSLQQVMGAGDFGTVQSGVGDLAAVGGEPIVQAGDVGTTAASTGTLSGLPNVGALGSPASGASVVPGAGAGPGVGGPVSVGALGGLGNRVTSTAGAGRTQSPAPVGGAALGGVPVGGVGATGPGRPSGAGRLGGINGINGLGGGIHGANAAGGVRAGNTMGQVRRLAGGVGAPGSVGSVGSAGTGSGAGVLTPPSGGTPGTPATAAGTGAASKSVGGQVGRGMTPMMGAPMMGQGQSKTSKVKAVTSAVEEDDNVADLLGERPAVVPGVIGAWARG